MVSYNKHMSFVSSNTKETFIKKRNSSKQLESILVYMWHGTHSANQHDKELTSLSGTLARSWLVFVPFALTWLPATAQRWCDCWRGRGRNLRDSCLLCLSEWQNFGDDLDSRETLTFDLLKIKGQDHRPWAFDHHATCGDLSSYWLCYPTGVSTIVLINWPAGRGACPLGAVLVRDGTWANAHLPLWLQLRTVTQQNKKTSGSGKPWHTWPRTQKPGFSSSVC